MKDSGRRRLLRFSKPRRFTRHIILDYRAPEGSQTIDNSEEFERIRRCVDEGRDPFELMSEIEEVLGIHTCPVNWPIGCGKNFKGVYDRQTKTITTFTAAMGGQKEVASRTIDVEGEDVDAVIGSDFHAQLKDDIELLDGASDPLDQELVNAGKLSPVFFGSALTNFGVETFLEHFLKMTSSPLPRRTTDGEVVTVVGTIPCAAPGESLVVTGEWMTHPVHGEQLQAHQVERHMPTTETEILSYLSSGVIKGVGPATAQRLDSFAFLRRLTALGIRCYRHYPIAGYPSDVTHIVSDEGLGKNDYVETSRPLVVVTAPGPGSGKMATCLSQLYHDYKRGISAGYAKFETFPIWNLPLKHPVNLAYEAATADLDDVNMIDPFHLEAYGKTAVNYNRDVEIFPVLSAIFNKIQGQSPYQSPTDMGVNMAGNCIVDDDVCCAASRMEILRRYYTACVERRRGKGSDETVRKLELVMQQGHVTPEICPAVSAALTKAEATGGPAGALVLPDGRVVTGRTSDTLGAASAMLLNALKALGGIADHFELISAQVLEPVCRLKTEYLGHKNPRLHTDEVLMALTISALTNPLAELAQQQLPKLRGCDAHFTVILSEVDETLLKRLGINVSCEAKYETKKLYHR